ncbi:MAG: ATP-binding protein [Candidatus Muiribacteriota bacterium]
MQKEIKLKAEPSALKKIRDFIKFFFEHIKFNNALIENDLKLAAVELAANIIKHATGSNSFLIRLQKEKELIKLFFIYEDIFFKQPEEIFSKDELRENGFGIYLVKKLCDKLDFKYEKKRGKVIVSAEKRLLSE